MRQLYQIRRIMVSTIALCFIMMIIPAITGNDHIASVTSINIDDQEPPAPFVIQGNISNATGSPCNVVLMNITNLNTGENWDARTSSTSGYYSVLLSSYDVSKGDVIQFKASGCGQKKKIEDVVTQGDFDSGGIIKDIQLEVISDPTPPVITDVANSTPTTDSVIITWTTDERSNSLVKYGTESGNYTDTTVNLTARTSHIVRLSELSAGTTYYYIVKSTDLSDNSAQSSEYSFTTAGNTNITPSETISISSAIVDVNDTIVIPVTIANATGIQQISLNITFDPDVVTIINITANDCIPSSTISYSLDAGIATIELTNDNITVTNATTLIDITIQTWKNSTTTVLELHNVEIVDDTGSHAPLSTVNGSVMVCIKGDFNFNNRVDIGDAAKVAFMVAEKVEEDPRADFNNNGRVDVGDAAKISFYLAQKVSEL